MMVATPEAPNSMCSLGLPGRAVPSTYRDPVLGEKENTRSSRIKVLKNDVEDANATKCTAESDMPAVSMKGSCHGRTVSKPATQGLIEYGFRS